MSIIFYDGNCGLCQRSIRFLFKIDKKKKLYFAPLNGKTFYQIYGEYLSELNTLRLYSNSKTFEKSSALLELSLILGGYFKLFYIFKVVPKSFRDFIYDQIAKKRQSISCVLIKKDDRFLD